MQQAKSFGLSNTTAFKNVHNDVATLKNNIVDGREDAIAGSEQRVDNDINNLYYQMEKALGGKVIK